MGQQSVELMWRALVELALSEDEAALLLGWLVTALPEPKRHSYHTRYSVPVGTVHRLKACSQ